MQDQPTSGEFFERDRKWMTYINAEVAGVCSRKGWRHQIRRKWSVREKPVAESSIDDYEWKLITEGEARTPEASPSDLDEGIYFVLCYDRHNRKFVLQHDTDHCGDPDDSWFTFTYTELHLHPWLYQEDSPRSEETFRLAIARARDVEQLPPKGWLERLLMDLTAKFSPNHFSLT